MKQPEQLSQFWREVIEAHDMVTVNHNVAVNVARNGKEAHVSWQTDNFPPHGFVQVHVREVDTETHDPLPVP